MKRLSIVGSFLLTVVMAGLLWPASFAVASMPAPQVQGSQAGITPFISNVTLDNVPLSTLVSVSFTIQPMAGSTTTPISATYDKAYFANRPSLVSNTSLTVPVFGLYASAVDHVNTVDFAVTTTSGTTQLSTSITTTPWYDPWNGSYTTNMRIVQARNDAVHLGYSYFMIKAIGTSQTGTTNPIVMDTDGQVRWVADSMVPGGTSVSGFYNQSFYMTIGAVLYRMNLDGSTTMVRDFTGVDGTSGFWHNIDPGKTGMFLAADGPSGSIESTVFEVDGSGNVLKTFDLYQIISQAMRAGGDDPSGFVSQGGDWFHMNAVTYWPAQNEVVVSSRENFVIGLNYDTGKIAWILGDPTKQWYQYKSLRHFALKLAPGSLPPIGQHAVSFTPTGQLLLFNDGQGSSNHSPAGITRNYSFPQMFQLNLVNRTATQTWAYLNPTPIFSNICSSVYQAGGNSYLADYAAEGSGSPDLIGLGANNAVAFDYQLTGAGYCSQWNAYPIALDSLQFTS